MLSDTTGFAVAAELFAQELTASQTSCKISVMSTLLEIQQQADDLLANARKTSINTGTPADKPKLSLS